MCKKSLRDPLRVELERALAQIEAGAEPRATFHELASLAGKIASGGELPAVNESAAATLAERHMSGHARDALLDVVCDVALAHEKELGGVTTSIVFKRPSENAIAAEPID